MGAILAGQSGTPYGPNAWGLANQTLPFLEYDIFAIDFVPVYGPPSPNHRALARVAANKVIQMRERITSMNARDAKKLVDRIFLERFETWGYSPNPAFLEFITEKVRELRKIWISDSAQVPGIPFALTKYEDGLATCCLKFQSDTLATFISPTFHRRPPGWDVRYECGIYCKPLEQAIDDLGGRDLCGQSIWTVRATNPNFPSLRATNPSFPPDYNRVTRIDSESGEGLPKPVGLTETSVHAWANSQLNFIEHYSLPWLENIDSESKLSELLSQTRLLDWCRTPVAHFLAKDYDAVRSEVARIQDTVTRIRTIQNSRHENHPFYANLLRACA